MSAASNVVISVQHTGTRFLLHHLNCTGEHTYPNNMRNVHSRLRDERGIIPLRHPARVYESWVRRDRDLAFLEQQYRCMICELKGYDLTYVDVERSGDPVAAQTGVGKTEVTKRMQARVPAFVMDWYEYVSKQAVTLDQLEK